MPDIIDKIIKCVNYQKKKKKEKVIKCVNILRNYLIVNQKILKEV